MNPPYTYRCCVHSVVFNTVTAALPSGISNGCTAACTSPVYACCGGGVHVVVGVTHMHITILLLIRITHTQTNKQKHLVLLEQHPQQLQCM